MSEAVRPGSRAGEDILFENRGAILRVTLNRPAALNALSHEMALDLHDELRQAVGDNGVRAIVVGASGDKAFCAGGDVRRLYDEGRAGSDYPYDFYRDEYHLNSDIFHCPKPYVALMDGIVMGGGVGISVHGSHRIVSDGTAFAMPETGIGLFPDVGGGHFLSRLPGELGMYLALTGARFKAADALYAKVGDAYVPRPQLEDLVAALAEADYSDGDDFATVSAVIAILKADAGPAPITEQAARIAEHFSADRLSEIMAGLEAAAGSDPWIEKTLQTMRGKSPTSMHLAFRQIRTGRDLGFNDNMRMEYRIACGCIEGHDFYEGVRAVVIDKDQAPKWRPAHLREMNTGDVDDYFNKEARGGDLQLPEGSSKDYHRPRMT